MKLQRFKSFLVPLVSAFALLGYPIQALCQSMHEPGDHGSTVPKSYDIRQYADPVTDKQDIAVNHFNDVLPSDWAFQALTSLSARYGCVSGHSGLSFDGGQSLTRFEAAALLLSCLDRVSVVTDDLKRLLLEFDKELTLLRGRAEALDARAGVLAAAQFSTTTKLNVAVFNWFAANTFSGSSKASQYRSDYGGLNNAYGLVPTLTTSFTGKDSLKIIGLTGNCAPKSPAAAAPYLSTYAPQCSAGVLSDSGVGDNGLVLWRLFYTTPILSDKLFLTVGPQLYAYDFLPVSNAVFGAKAGSQIGLRALPLDILQNAGVPGVYPYVLGAGGGLTYQDKGWSASFGFVSSGASDATSGDGLFGESSVKETVLQLALTKPSAGFQVAWSQTSYPSGGFVFQEGTPLTANPFQFTVPFSVNSLSGGGYFYLSPNLSISGGINALSYTSTAGNSGVSLSSGETASGLTGVATLQWERALFSDLTLGVSYGVPSYIYQNSARTGQDQRPDMLLFFANWSASDHIQISPSIYWIKGLAGNGESGLSTLGAILMTSVFF